jgi:hypothetical protein
LAQSLGHDVSVDHLLTHTHQVHGIDQIVAIVVRQNGAFRPDKDIDLQFPMRDTGAWKPDAQLKNVVGVAAWILRPYKGVDLSEPQLILEIFKDFEIIWLEVISPMFENQFGRLALFEHGGNLDKKLLGPELHQKLRDIRIILKEARGQNVRGSGKTQSLRTEGGSSEASASIVV